MIERIEKATGLLREALDVLQHEDPGSHRRKELAMNINSYALQAMNDTTEVLRKALETTGQEGEKV